LGWFAKMVKQNALAEKLNARARQGIKMLAAGQIKRRVELGSGETLKSRRV
jgi:hypothetical protein